MVDAITNASTVAPGATDLTPALGPFGGFFDCKPTIDGACIKGVLSEMDDRLAPLEASCSHNAVFALLYDKVTAQFLTKVEGDPHFFHSNKFVDHWDRAFANYYFKAYDDWYSGDPSRKAGVAGAWHVAFNSADKKTTTAGADIYLGVNAHVLNDLPFVIERIGLHEDDGYSTKPDQDKVNQVLQAAYRPAFEEAAQKLDPSVNPGYPSGTETYGYGGSFSIVEAWREQAWRDAEALTLADDAHNQAAHDAIARGIHEYATHSAESIATAEASNEAGVHARDTWCATHH